MDAGKNLDRLMPSRALVNWEGVKAPELGDVVLAENKNVYVEQQDSARIPKFIARMARLRTKKSYILDQDQK